MSLCCLLRKNCSPFSSRTHSTEPSLSFTLACTPVVSGKRGPDRPPCLTSEWGPTLSGVPRWSSHIVHSGPFSVGARVRAVSPLFWLFFVATSISSSAKSRRQMIQNRWGFGGWNQHPAREPPTLKAQEECLEDCEPYSSSMDSVHFTEVSTTGMLRKVGDIWPLLGGYSIFAAPTSHVNPTAVIWWLWILPTHPLLRPLPISPGTPLCNGSRAYLHFGVRFMALVVPRVGLPTRTVTL